MVISSKKISFKTILLMGIGGFLVTLGIGMILKNENFIFDKETGFLGLALGLVSLFSLLIANEKSKGSFFHIVYLAVFFLLYVFPRILSYLFFPNWVIFPVEEGIGIKEINSALFYLLLGSIALLIAFWAVEGISKYSCREIKKTTKEVFEIPFAPLAFSVIFVLGMEWAILSIAKVSVYGNLQAESWNSLLQVAKLIFDVDMIVFIALVGLAWGAKSDDSIYIKIGFIVAMYMLYTVSFGVRGAGLRVTFMIMAVLLWERGNFRATFVQFCVVLVLLNGAGLIFYPIATQERINLSVREENKVEQLNKKLGFRSNDEGLGLYGDIPKFANRILNRFGVVDYAVLATSEELGNPAAKSHYLSLDYGIKSIINFIVPGIIFPEAELSTSRVIPIVYRGVTEEYVKNHSYFSEFWTLWGLASAIFGRGQGVAFIFVVGILMQTMYILIEKTSDPYRIFLGSCYLLLVPGLVFSSQGIDHTITTILVRYLQGIFSLIIIYLFVITWNRIFNRGAFPGKGV